MSEIVDEILHNLHFFHPITIRGRGVQNQWALGHEEWKQSFLPEDFTGLSVLDVGCNNGYFSFLAEDRGAAEIIAIDDPWDPQEQCVDSRAIMSAIILNWSKVRYRTGSVYELAYLERKFDVVIFFEVFYHLKHPQLALEEIAKVCGGDLYLCTHFMPGDENVAKIKPECGQDYTLWFVPTVPTVVTMLVEAGFTDVKELGRKNDRVMFKASAPDLAATRQRAEALVRIGKTWEGRK